MVESDAPKKPRGNPAFQKKKHESQTTQPKNTMSDEKEEVKKETQPAAEPAAAPSDTLPSDLFSDKIPGEEVLPLDGQVKEKSYAALPGDAGAGGTIPPTGGEQKPFESGTTSTGTPPASAAPAVAPVTPEELQSQAKQTVDLMLRGYEKMHQLGRWVGKIDQNDLTQMHAQGKINLEQNLPLGKKSITVGGFFAEYNQGIDENITVSEQFKTDIRPPLTRLCLKHNILLDDLWYVGSLVTEDIVTKASMLIGLRKSANMVLEAVIAMQKAQTTPASKEEKKKEAPADLNPPNNPDGEWTQAAEI